MAALKTGWSPSNTRPELAQELVESIASDPSSYLKLSDDIDGEGPPVTLPDGSQTKRLPGIVRWIWQDGFCGVISLRWQKGKMELPPTCLGHVGYAVVPWRRQEGLATAALIELLPIAQSFDLSYVDLTVDPDNRASQRVIEKVGGRRLSTFPKPDAYDASKTWLYRIDTCL
ncbi:MAG: GNAT family N-acetyltransferase [Pseudomonadota bacterium]|nr:GNAT family N-acetyltransferase [Pseudomonadota bacterium]